MPQVLCSVYALILKPSASNEYRQHCKMKRKGCVCSSEILVRWIEDEGVVLYLWINAMYNTAGGMKIYDIRQGNLYWKGRQD